MRYQLILMDADDTLFDFPAGNRRAVNLLMEELGLASETAFDEYQKHNHACWEALERGEMNQAQLHTERFRRFLAEKGRSDDPKAVADRFAQLLGQQVIPLPHAEEVVRAITEKLPVVILTNGITVIQKSRFARSTMTPYFKRIVISQEEGIAKPDPALFRIALDGVDPGDALMIGDGVKSDVLGANRAGIDMCWYNPKGAQLPEGMHAEYIVNDLRDCVSIALQD